MGAGKVICLAMSGILLPSELSAPLIFMKWQFFWGILLLLVGELRVAIRMDGFWAHAQACRFSVPYSFGVVGLKICCTFAA